MSSEKQPLDTGKTGMEKVSTDVNKEITQSTPNQAVVFGYNRSELSSFSKSVAKQAGIWSLEGIIISGAMLPASYVYQYAVIDPDLLKNLMVSPKSFSLKNITSNYGIKIAVATNLIKSWSNNAKISATKSSFLSYRPNLEKKGEEHLKLEESLKDNKEESIREEESFIFSSFKNVIAPIVVLSTIETVVTQPFKTSGTLARQNINCAPTYKIDKLHVRYGVFGPALAQNITGLTSFVIAPPVKEAIMKHWNVTNPHAAQAIAALFVGVPTSLVINAIGVVNTNTIVRLDTNTFRYPSAKNVAKDLITKNGWKVLIRGFIPASISGFMLQMIVPAAESTAIEMVNQIGLVIPKITACFATFFSKIQNPDLVREISTPQIEEVKDEEVKDLPEVTATSVQEPKEEEESQVKPKI